MKTEFAYKDIQKNEIGFVSLNPGEQTEILFCLKLSIDGEIPNHLISLINVFEKNLSREIIYDSFENIIKKYYKKKP